MAGKGLYANIHAKRKRGSKMRKKGAKGAPTAANFRRAAQTARKMGKKTFTHKGKKFSTLLKGEKPNKIMPELSGKTSKKIKKFVGA